MSYFSVMRRIFTGIPPCGRHRNALPKIENVNLPLFVKQSLSSLVVNQAWLTADTSSLAREEISSSCSFWRIWEKETGEETFKAVLLNLRQFSEAWTSTLRINSLLWRQPFYIFKSHAAVPQEWTGHHKNCIVPESESPFLRSPHGQLLL